MRICVIHFIHNGGSNINSLTICSMCSPERAPPALWRNSSHRPNTITGHISPICKYLEAVAPDISALPTFTHFVENNPPSCVRTEWGDCPAVGCRIFLLSCGMCDWL